MVQFHFVFPQLLEIVFGPECIHGRRIRNMIPGASRDFDNQDRFIAAVALRLATGNSANAVLYERANQNRIGMKTMRRTAHTNAYRGRRRSSPSPNIPTKATSADGSGIGVNSLPKVIALISKD